MSINTRIWMTGSLEWFGYIGEVEMFLGQRSCGHYRVILFAFI